MRLAFAILFAFAASVHANTLNFTGRLLTVDGTPPAGVAKDLTFNVIDNSTTVCTRTLNNVPIKDGVFSVDVDFTGLCISSIELIQHMSNALAAERDISLQVQDTTTTTIAYEQQGLGVVPYTLVSQLARNMAPNSITAQKLNIVIASCDDGEGVLFDGAGNFKCEPVTNPTAGVMNNSVGTAEIQNGAVGNADLAANSITSSKFATGAVTKAKISGLAGCSTDGQAVVVNGTGFNCGGSSLGDISSVTAGTGLTGGGTGGDLALAVDFSVVQRRGTMTCPAGQAATGFDASGNMLCGQFLAPAGNLLTGPVTLPGPPTSDNEAATKDYVDTHAIQDSQITDLDATKLVGTLPTGGLPATIAITEADNLNFTGDLQINGNNVLTQADAGNGANQVIQIDGSGNLPAFDGSNITNLSATSLVLSVEEVPETTDAAGCNDVTADRTISNSDNRKVLVAQSGVTIALPSVSTINAGTTVTVKKVANSNLTSPNANCNEDQGVSLTINSGDTIDGQVVAQLSTNYAFLTIVADPLRNEWVVVNKSPIGAIVGIQADCAGAVPAPFDSAAPTGTTLSSVLPGDTAPGTINHGSIASIVRYTNQRVYTNVTCGSNIETRISSCDDGTWRPFNGSATQRECEDQHACYFPDGTTLAHNAVRTVYQTSSTVIAPGDSCTNYHLDVICRNGMIHDYTGATVGSPILTHGGDITVNPSAGNTSTLTGAYASVNLTCTEQEAGTWYNTLACTGSGCCTAASQSPNRSRVCTSGSCPAFSHPHALCDETRTNAGYSIASSNCGSAVSCPAAPNADLVYRFDNAGSNSLQSGNVSCSGSDDCSCDHPFTAGTIAHNASVYSYSGTSGGSGYCATVQTTSTCNGDVEIGATGRGTYSTAPAANGSCNESFASNWYSTGSCSGANCCAVTNAQTTDSRSCDYNNTCTAWASASGSTSCTENIARNWYTPDAGPTNQICSGQGCCAGFLNTNDARTCTTGTCGAWSSGGSNAAAGFTTCSENVSGYRYSATSCTKSHPGNGVNDGNNCCSGVWNGGAHAISCNAGSCTNNFPHSSCTETRTSYWYSSNSGSCLAARAVNSTVGCGTGGCAGITYRHSSCTEFTTSYVATGSPTPVSSCSTVTNVRSRTWGASGTAGTYSGGNTSCYQYDPNTNYRYSGTVAPTNPLASGCIGSGCCLAAQRKAVRLCTGGNTGTSCSLTNSGGSTDDDGDFGSHVYAFCEEERGLGYSIPVGACPTPCAGIPDSTWIRVFDNNDTSDATATDKATHHQNCTGDQAGDCGGTTLGPTTTSGPCAATTIC